jgi:hypothetical protein
MPWTPPTPSPSPPVQLMKIAETTSGRNNGERRCVQARSRRPDLLQPPPPSSRTSGCPPLPLEQGARHHRDQCRQQTRSSRAAAAAGHHAGLGRPLRLGLVPLGCPKGWHRVSGRGGGDGRWWGRSSLRRRWSDGRNPSRESVSLSYLLLRRITIYYIIKTTNNEQSRFFIAKVKVVRRWRSICV